jgi:hypothetical protein
MLLRDDRQMALNDVETRCLEAADHHASSARRTDDAALAELFSLLAQERLQQAAALAPHIRALGDLPKTPDPDKEDFGQLLEAILPLFSGDARDSMLDEADEAEAALEEALAAAQRCALAPDTHDLLGAMQASVELARRQLAAHRTA